MKPCASAAAVAIASVASVELSLTMIQARGRAVCASTLAMVSGRKRASLRAAVIRM